MSYRATSDNFYELHVTCEEGLGEGECFCSSFLVTMWVTPTTTSGVKGTGLVCVCNQRYTSATPIPQGLYILFLHWLLFPSSVLPFIVSWRRRLFVCKQASLVTSHFTGEREKLSLYRSQLWHVIVPFISPALVSPPPPPLCLSVVHLAQAGSNSWITHNNTLKQSESSIVTIVSVVGNRYR